MACGGYAGITIVRGDDSDSFERTIDIELETDLDLTGCSAVLQIAALRWEFTDITEKILPVVISKEQSLSLKPGVETAGLKIFDANGKAMTVVSDIPVNILEQVVDNE